MRESTIFMNNPTVIDLAFIGNNGVLYGESIRPSIRLSGKQDGKESVVLDFSAAKKKIKALIDDPDTGFDHKCWINIDVIPANTVIFIDGNPVEAEDALEHWREYAGTAEVAVVTEKTMLRGPRNAFRFTHSFDLTPIEDYLNEEMEKAGFDVIVKLDERPEGAWNSCFLVPDIDEKEEFDAVVQFNYVHGLKDSTSWGCQNIAHGHQSFIMIRGPKNLQHTPDLSYLKVDLLETERRPFLFVNRENIIEETDTKVLFGYKTGRGYFEMSASTDAYQIRILDEETTIENLAEWFKVNYYKCFERSTGCELFVSEGLDKGAVVPI